MNTAEFNGGISRAGRAFLEMDRSKIHDEKLFDQNLEKVVSSFPLEVTLSNGFVSVTHETKMRLHLLEGDLVQLAARWADGGSYGTQSGDVVDISAYDRDGQFLGFVQEHVDIWELSPTDFGNRELACILPFVIANVKTVGTDEAATVTLQLTIEQGTPKRKIKAAAKQIVEKDLSERQAISRGSLLPSQFRLCSGFGASEPLDLPDTPNEAPAGSDNPKGKRKLFRDNVLVLFGDDGAMLPVLDTAIRNALKHIEETGDGRYSSDSEIEEAATFADRFKVSYHDLVEHFEGVFTGSSSSAYPPKPGEMEIYGNDNRHALMFSYLTWEPGNNNDIMSLLTGSSNKPLGFALVSKLEGDRSVSIWSGAIKSGKSAADTLKSGSVVDLDELESLHEKVSKHSIDSAELDSFALRLALHEILGAEENLGESDAYGSGSFTQTYSELTSISLTSHYLFDSTRNPPKSTTTPTERSDFSR